MDRLRATLGRRVGPFTVGQWLIVLVGGIALGLMVRRGFGRTLEAEPPAVMGDDFPLGIDRGVVVTGRAPTTVYFDDANRTVDQDGVHESPAPTKTGTDPAPKPPNYEPYRWALLAIGHDPKKVVNEEDIREGMRIIGHDPKKVIDPEDLAVLTRAAYERR